MTTKPYKPYNTRRMPCKIAPEIEYEAAMSRYLITPDGIIFKVRTVSTSDFSRWIRAIIVLQQPVLLDALQDLDYASSVDRWYAINLLMEHKIEVPLFSTFDQAQAVLDARK